MSFEEWVKAKGGDPAVVPETFRPVMLAAWKAEMAKESGEPPPKSAAAVLAEAREESARVQKITDIVAAAVTKPLVSSRTIDVIEALQKAAVDGKWTVEKFETAVQLEELRGGRPEIGFAPSFGGGNDEINAQIVECAVLRAGGKFSQDELQKQYPEQVIQAASRQWRHGLSLGELVLTFAHQGGYRGLSLNSNLKGALQCAFATRPELRAAEVPSTYSLPNILANIANKYMARAFLAVDPSWRQLASTRSVKDFKQITSFSLTGGLMYKKVAPSGEIQYAGVGEVVYNNKADTYAIILGLARTDLINDDMNALSGASTRLGRGGALKVNDVFWTTFLANSSFFTAGNNNAFTGASTALSLTSLGTADRNFRVQSDPDGFPIGILPRKLVVPTTLRVTALNLANSTFVVATNTSQTAALSPQNNVLVGAYDVVSSPYMENSSYTGNSNAAWYLLADPADLPVIEMCFLNGVEMPSVETADADFNQLGIAMRGVHDFGAALQEFRGGVRMAGA